MRRLLPPVLTALAVAAFAWLLARQDLWRRVLSALFPDSPRPVFPGQTIAQLTIGHLEVVGAALAATLALGIPLAVWVTRPSGRDFRPILDAVTGFGQSFPPVAVLALSMPLLGIGFAPSVLALFVYGLFPVVSNTMAGIDAVPAEVVDAAAGLGMGGWRILFTVELPLAARVIMSGVRTATAIGIGTATIAAVVGAGGLGLPIIAGINVGNSAYVLEGAVAAAALAVLADAVLAQAETALTPRALRP